MVTEYEAVARHVRKMAMKMYQPKPAAPEAMGLYTSGKVVRETLLQDVFSAFDLDNDGFVDSEELLQLGAARQKLRQRGMVWTEEKNRVLVESLDKNTDGMVSEAEFVQGFDAKTPSDLVEFTRLMMEYEAVARWVREQLKRGADSIQLDSETGPSSLRSELSVDSQTVISERPSGAIVDRQPYAQGSSPC